MSCYSEHLSTNLNISSQERLYFVHIEYADLGPRIHGNKQAIKITVFALLGCYAS